VEEATVDPDRLPEARLDPVETTSGITTILTETKDVEGGIAVLTEKDHSRPDEKSDIRLAMVADLPFAEVLMAIRK
jgi:hypothetical protein